VGVLKNNKYTMTNIRYIVTQYKIGTAHFNKTLKVLLPSKILYVYSIFNKKLGMVCFPLILVYLLDMCFLFLPISQHNGLRSLVLVIAFYFALWELIISRYTLPNWRCFIVRNSPVQTMASGLSLIKMSKSPVVGACVVCATGFIAGNEIFQALWPEAKTPGARLGEKNFTSYWVYPRNKN
jgi:hypothetical protein